VNGIWNSTFVMLCNVQNYRFGLLDGLKIETWLLKACPSYVLQYVGSITDLPAEIGYDRLT
jgi:hypothetical protein